MNVLTMAGEIEWCSTNFVTYLSDFKIATTMNANPAKNSMIRGLNFMRKTRISNWGVSDRVFFGQGFKIC